MIKRLLADGSALRYGLVGIANTVFGLGVIFLCKGVFGLGDAAANFIGYACGLVLSFTLNARYTFNYSGRMLPAAIRFVIVIGLAYLSNLGTVMAAIALTDWSTYFCQTLGVGPYAVVGYLGSRFFAFGDKQPIADTAALELERR